MSYTVILIAPVLTKVCENDCEIEKQMKVHIVETHELCLSNPRWVIAQFELILLKNRPARWTGFKTEAVRAKSTEESHNMNQTMKKLDPQNFEMEVLLLLRRQPAKPNATCVEIRTPWSCARSVLNKTFVPRAMKCIINIQKELAMFESHSVESLKKDTTTRKLKCLVLDQLLLQEAPENVEAFQVQNQAQLHQELEHYQESRPALVW